MYGGSGGLVEDNLIESNTYTGINVEGDGTMIRRNRVIDTGGTTVPIGSAYGITTDGAADCVTDTSCNLRGGRSSDCERCGGRSGQKNLFH